MLPTASMLSNDVVRLYVAHADQSVVSRIGFIDVSLASPTQVIRQAEAPLLDIGEPGTFDDNGVNPCSIVRMGASLRLYYAGYQLQRKIPYTLFGGVAVAKA